MFTQKLSGKNRGLKEVSDNDIITRILENGEKELFNELYDRYSNKIYHKCISFTKDREIAKDLTHDILVKIFLNISKFKGKSKFSLWVYSITYNYCIDFLRKKKRLQIDDYEESEFENFASNDDELEEKVLKEIRLQQLEDLLEKIKVEDKLILMMYYKDDMSVRRIATILEVGESAVKMRLKRARTRLAKKFEELNK